METPAHITLLGNSLPYLAVRADVLQHFWRIETVVLDSGDVPKFETDVMVICASIPEPERQEWVDRARLNHPLLLIVRVNGFGSGPLAGADATVDEDDGPGALVSTIYGLLTERGLESRSWPILPEADWVQ